MFKLVYVFVLPRSIVMKQDVRTKSMEGNLANTITSASPTNVMACVDVMLSMAARMAIITVALTTNVMKN